MICRGNAFQKIIRKFGEAIASEKWNWKVLEACASLKLDKSPSKLGSLPVEVIEFSSQGQNDLETIVSQAYLCHLGVIFFNSVDIGFIPV